MYSKFRTDVLAGLSELDGDVLHRVAEVLDSVSAKYKIEEVGTAIAVLGREQFKEIAMAYCITKKTEGLSKETLKNVGLALDNFIKAMNKPIEQIRTVDIRGYLYSYQQKRGITNRSLDALRSKLCTFFRWCAAEGYISSDPTMNIKPIKFTAAPRKALSQFELERVRRACKNDREICIVEVLYSTGCRVTELCNIKVSDIDFEKREITVLGKGNKYRQVFLNAKALISIQAYLKSRRINSEYLMCNDRHGGGQMKRSIVEDLFSRIEDETGIRVTPHIMRHTMATQALTGTGVEVVQQMLGHSNIGTTMIYAEVDRRLLRTAHEKCVI